MKHSILFLLVAFLTVTAWADGKEGSKTTSTTNTVEMEIKDVPSQGKNKRSLSILPSAEYDATTLYLSAPLLWEDVVVMLYDAYGSVLFTDTVTLSPAAYSIELTGWGTKDFVIEIVVDETIYYGDFSL